MRYYFTTISVVTIMIIGIFSTQSVNARLHNVPMEFFLKPQKTIILANRAVSRYPVRRATRKLRTIRSQQS